MNVFPVFLGGCDIAAVLASDWAGQLVLCNDFVRSAAYLITGPEAEHDFANAWLTERVRGLGERPVVWVMGAQTIRFYASVADFAANLVGQKPAADVPVCAAATDCRRYPVGGLMPFEWDSTWPMMTARHRRGQR